MIEKHPSTPLINPEYSFRYESEEILDRYGSLEQAFEEGAYMLVAEFAGKNTELEGCGLVLGGAIGAGLRVLSRNKVGLSNRGYLCKAFAEWLLGNKAQALLTLTSTTPEGAYSSEIESFKTLLGKDQIRVFITSSFLSTTGKGVKEGDNTFGTFAVSYVGTQQTNNSYDYNLEEPFDEFLQKLDSISKPDFIYCMTPQWPTPNNFEKVKIPKVIWCHDGDMFLHRACSTFDLYDVRICLTTLEQFEMNSVVDGPTISNFMSDPLNTQFPDVTRCSEKEYDVVFSGSVFDSFHTEKSRFIYKLSELGDRYSVRVVDGYLPKEEYFELLSKTKFLPIVSRIAGNPTPRWRDALSSSAYVLYPEGTTFGKAFPGCHSVGTQNLIKDIKRHIDNYDQREPGYELGATSDLIEKEMKIFQEGNDVLFERQLKLAAFLALVIFNGGQKSTRNVASDQKVSRSQQKYEIWPTPCVDTAIYGREDITRKIGRLADSSIQKYPSDKRSTNNLAYIYAALANVGSESLEQVKRRTEEADQLFQDGCRRFPTCLIFHFNYAHWTFFRDTRWDVLNEPDGFGNDYSKSFANCASAGAAMFWRILDDWDRFVLDPTAMTVGLPYVLLEKDKIFPYYEYSQKALISIIKRNSEPEISGLKNMLKGAAYGYLGWEAQLRGQLDEAIEYLDQALELNLENFPLRKFQLEILIKQLGEGTESQAELITSSTELSIPQPNVKITHRSYYEAKTIESFCECARIYPAILLSHIHKVANCFVQTGQQDELREILVSWYRLGNVTYSTAPAERDEREISWFIGIGKFEEFFPESLTKIIEEEQSCGSRARERTQFESLVLKGVELARGIKKFVGDPSDYRLFPKEILTEEKTIISNRFEIRLRHYAAVYNVAAKSVIMVPYRVWGFSKSLALKILRHRN